MRILDYAHASVCACVFVCARARECVCMYAVPMIFSNDLFVETAAANYFCISTNCFCNSVNSVRNSSFSAFINYTIEIHVHKVYTAYTVYMKIHIL